MKTLVSALFATVIVLAQEPAPPLPPAGFTETVLSRLAMPSIPAPQDSGSTMRDPSGLTVSVNESFVLERPAGIRRISITNGDIAEAVAVSSSEVLLNGKSAGDTSLIIWDPKGARSTFEIHVLASTANIEAVRAELGKEAGPEVSLAVEGSNVFLRGTVPDPIAGDRAYAIASTLGKVVNLLQVLVPAAQPQILLKVRFADVDRQAASQLGINLFGANLLKGLGSITTGQFGSPPAFDLTQGSNAITFSQLLNVFFYRPDINLGAFIQALESKNILQMLAEPNLLTVSGRPASFLAGGEFPFPTLQGGGSGVGQITIQFKEFGIRLNFLPTVTPRGTIHLQVTPEVSSLDYSNGLTVSGFTIPGLSTRRVETEIELEDGQSFAIAGLLDNQVTEQLDKIPGLGNIPVLGKLFQSRSLTKHNSELLVLVTPELVRPIPIGVKPPDVKMTLPFLKGTAADAPRTPGQQVTGSVPVLPKRDSMPLEELKSEMQAAGPDASSTANPAAVGTPPAPAPQPALPGTPAPPPNPSSPTTPNK